MVAISCDSDSIPEILKGYDQWVCWKYSRQSTGSTHRWCKLPVNPRNGLPAQTDKPQTWTSFEKAVGYFENNCQSLGGIGLVFTPGDPLVGIDLDDCRDPASGQLAPWAKDVVAELDSYTEVSPSGTGVKIILSSTEAVSSRRKSQPGIEVYASGRYFTVTGHPLDGFQDVRDRREQLLSVYRHYFPDESDISPRSPRFVSAIEVADEIVLKRARSAKNGDKFRRLWAGDTGGHGHNCSQADQALCCILAFWCGPHPDQIDRLFRQSSLMRDKWDDTHYQDKTTYGEKTIRMAINRQQILGYFRWAR